MTDNNISMTPYYQDSACTIYCGDCRDILPQLGPVDHVITDPPYSEHVHRKQWIGHALTDNCKRTSTAHKSLGFDALTDIDRTSLVEFASANCARWFLCFCDIEGLGDWIQALNTTGSLEYIRACVWDKVDSAPQFTGDRPASSAELIVVAHPPGKKQWNGGGKRNVFRFAVNQERGAKPHPSTKPIALMTELVNLFTDESDTILDPFMGSGTTLEAAKLMGRKAVGIECNESYCEIAANRLRQEVLL